MDSAPPKSQRLFLPGDFPSTNKLLDLQRAEGFYRGVGAAGGGQSRASVARVNGRRAPRVSYAAEVSRIRRHTRVHALQAKLQPAGGPVVLEFCLVTRAGRYDPSAWYLSAKAVEDGLVDAEVISGDRFGVHHTTGCCPPPGSVVTALHAMGFQATVPRSGMAVLIREAHHGAY